MLHWIAQAGEHSYTVKLYSISNGRKSEEDEESGSVNVMDAGGHLIIEEFSCTPQEVGLYEWGGDKDVVSCTAVVVNNGPTIQIAPRVVIDDVETLWFDVKNLPTDSKMTLDYKVKFNDKLAQIMYGPSATAVSFVRSVEERGETVCQRGVCYNTTRVHFFPKNHTISLKIYKAKNFLSTKELLAKSTGINITVKYDNYVEKQYGKYVIVDVVTPVVTSTLTEVAVVYIFGSSAEGAGFIGGAFIGDLVSKGWDWIWGDN